jgi:hypothetical protein
MEQSYQGHQEVDGVKDQLATLMQDKLPADVAAQAKTLDAGLTKIGGVVPVPGSFSGRRPTPEPNALKSFVELNDAYNTMVSMVQVGLDMAPTPSQIATWQSDCGNYNRTVAEWKKMQQQLTGFNAVLAKNQLHELTLSPTRLTDDACRLTSEAGSKAAHK